MLEKLLTTKQVSEILSVRPEHVRELCRRNLLRHHTLPAARRSPNAKRSVPRYRIPESAIAEYLSSNGEPLPDAPVFPVKRTQWLESTDPWTEEERTRRARRMSRRSRGLEHPDWSEK